MDEKKIRDTLLIRILLHTQTGNSGSGIIGGAMFRYHLLGRIKRASNRPH
jgi:hypothetical protein